jgi:uncharacterized protein with HEPN domain
MSPEIKKLLFDISESIKIIEGHLENIKEFSEYNTDLKTIDAVERRLAIIGEALWKADKEMNDLAISNKSKIISLRHILVHDYDLIENETIWVICKKHIPILKTEVEQLLK